MSRSDPSKWFVLPIRLPGGEQKYIAAKAKDQKGMWAVDNIITHGNAMARKEAIQAIVDDLNDTEKKIWET